MITEQGKLYVTCTEGSDLRLIQGDWHRVCQNKRYQVYIEQNNMYMINGMWWSKSRFKQITEV